MAPEFFRAQRVKRGAGVLVTEVQYMGVWMRHVIWNNATENSCQLPKLMSMALDLYYKKMLWLNFSIYRITQHKNNRLSVKFIYLLTLGGSISSRAHYTLFCCTEESINTEVMVHNGLIPRILHLNLNSKQIKLYFFAIKVYNKI
jgi:hypothetical protein